MYCTKYVTNEISFAFSAIAEVYSNRATAYYRLGKILILSFLNLSTNQK